MFEEASGTKVAGFIAILVWSWANAAHADQTIRLADQRGTPDFRGAHAAPVNDGNGNISDGSLARDDAGNLYGTTATGGSYGRGMVYRLAPDGTKTILHSFAGGRHDGATPLGGVIADAAGNLYGATSAGGSVGCDDGDGCGTVFEITHAGTERILYTFDGGTDGAMPVGNLVLGRSGHLYGTTSNGGLAGCGTVFELSSGTERVLHAFAPSEGSHAMGILHADQRGNLYGAITGEHESLYRLTPDGTLTILFQFA